jgi:hypothetical protein
MKTKPDEYIHGCGENWVKEDDEIVSTGQHTFPVHRCCQAGRRDHV